MTLKFGEAGIEIAIAPGLLDTLPASLDRTAANRRAFVVSDEVVWGLFGQRLSASLQTSGIEFHAFLIPPGESSKSLTTLSSILDRLGELRWQRDELLLAIGGGVVTDLAGLAAGLWKRGLPLVLVPTTLEAQIDAAIGGKCGVNHAKGKNLIGMFFHPKHVFIDPICLLTLSPRDFSSGLAESLKHAFIADADFLRWQVGHRDRIMQREPAILRDLIHRNILIKAAFVEADERETGNRRMLLNFGHTIGHAIESACGYELRHGECVALGMLAAARISHRLGLLKAEGVGIIEQVLASFGLPLQWRKPLLLADLERAMSQDKKVRQDQCNFILLESIGKAVVRSDVPRALVQDALRETLGSGVAYD